MLQLMLKTAVYRFINGGIKHVIGNSIIRKADITTHYTSPVNVLRNSRLLLNYPFLSAVSR